MSNRLSVVPKRRSINILIVSEWKQDLVLTGEFKLKYQRMAKSQLVRYPEID